MIACLAICTKCIQASDNCIFVQNMAASHCCYVLFRSLPNTANRIIPAKPQAKAVIKLTPGDIFHRNALDNAAAETTKSLNR